MTLQGPRSPAVAPPGPRAVRARRVRRITLNAIGALVVGIATAVFLPASIAYPVYCANEPSLAGEPPGPEYCISYDPALGRYENPPPNVPGDVSAFATATAKPELARAVAGLIAFVLAFYALRVLAGGQQHFADQLEAEAAEGPREPDEEADPGE